jgi:hypothetical protein
MAAVDGYPAGSPGTDPFPTTLEPYLGAVLLESFFYGLYTVLFSICAYVLLRRRRKIHWILPFFAVAMYSLATADMAYTLWLLFGKLLKLDLSYQALRWKFWLYVTNNVLADTLLLYRCYVVWDYDKRVVVGPALLLIAATVCGYLFEGSTSTTLFTNSWVYPLATLFLNVILTILTASRIWFLSQKARRLLDPSLLQQYNVTLSILIESGFVYSLYMVLDLAFHKDPSGSIVLDASLIQIVGIMPTLIIAQIGVGRAVHDIETNFRTTHTESAPVSTSVSSKMDIRSPTTESTLSMPLAGGIAIRVDTSKHMYDVSLSPEQSPHKKEDNDYPYDGVHISTSSKETFASRELYNTRPRYNPPYLHEIDQEGHQYYQNQFKTHRDRAIVDLPRDIESGDVDRYYEPANGSVLDYVLRGDVEKAVVPWEESGDNRTPSPRRQSSARLKKTRPSIRLSSRE